MSSHSHQREAVIGLFHDLEPADRAVRKLIDEDFPMDRISLFGSGRHSGDDPLGIYYDRMGQRMKGWGKQGAFWGGLWGLLTGAAGLFLVPGVGPVLAAGSIVGALGGAAVGAGVGGGVMAGAAAVSHLGTALHRVGVPDGEVNEIHEALKRGDYAVLLIIDEGRRWADWLENEGAHRTVVFPYSGVLEGIGGEGGNPGGRSPSVDYPH